MSSIKSDPNVHITKADKACAIVLMDKTDYIDKMSNLLSDENTYEKLLSNPLERVNAGFHKKIRELLGANQLSTR